MVATRPAPADAPGTRLDPAAEPSARFRRPWWDRLEIWTGVAIVVACCLFVLFQLQPDLLLRNTTPAGGDTGAHVWWPAYLRDHLLPQGRIAGWAPDWFAGFPAGQFYFPFPALVIVALDAVLPYNIAFKLVTALGPIALPAAAYAFGRGLRAPRPAPALFAVGATVLLFFKGAPGADAAATRVAGNQHIMGGNLASNFAGEFSFTLALALALFFLGALAYSLEHRRRMWLPAVLFAAVVMSHLVVGMFAVIGALVVWLARRPERTFPTAAAVGGIVAQRRVTIELAALTAVMGLAFRFWESLTDLFHSTPVWNLRLLPFWYLLLLLLAMLGAAELIRGAGFLLARVPHPLLEPLLPAPERVPVPAASDATRETPSATAQHDDDGEGSDRD